MSTSHDTDAMADHSIPFNRPSFIANEIRYLREAIERQQLSGDGHFTKLCHERLRELTGAKTALLAHSCTAALDMAAILCDLDPGDEVIMPSFTFVSTANAVVLRRAVPVFVDIEPDTLNIDPLKIAAAITPKTRAIFVVHYAGIPADMDPIMELARNHNLVVVEDAAQALGSSYKGKPAGGLADLAAFSFHETKNVISGEGGALIVNTPHFAERAEIIREKGTNRSLFMRGQVDKYTWVDLGSSFLPGELVASFLYAQLEMAEMVNARRLSMFERYSEAFADLVERGKVGIPVCPPDRTSNGHIFYLMLPTNAARNAFIDRMHERNITTPFHYVPLHSAPAGLRYARASGSLAVTDDIAARLVRLPLYFDLGVDIERVISEARLALGANSGD